MSLNSYDLLSLNGGTAEGHQLSKSAKKRRNRKAKAAEREKEVQESKGKGKAKGETGSAKKESTTTKVVNLGTGNERTNGKKSGAFTPVQRRRENGQSKTETSVVVQQANATVDQGASSSAKSQGSSNRDAVLLVKNLLDDKNQELAGDLKKQLASSISDAQKSGEYGLRAAEAVLSVSSDVKGLGANASLASKSRQFLVEIVSVLTTIDASQEGSKSEEHRKNVKDKFERLSKAKQVQSGPKLLEKARVTLDWNKLVGKELVKSLGGVKEDPSDRLSSIIKKFKDSCLDEQGALLRSGDSSGYELPPEILKIDSEISQLEQKIAELKAKRGSIMEKHRSKQSAEKKHLLSFFDRAMESASKLDSEFAGLKNVLNSGGKRAKATKEQADLLARYVSTLISLAACKTIQQKELHSRFEFYVQQIAEFANDTNSDNESFVKKLSTMATNALNDSTDICETIVGIATRIEKYTSQLQVKTLDVAPGAMKEFHENVAKLQDFHRQTVEKAQSDPSMNFASASVSDVQRASTIIKRALKDLKLTGKEVEAAAPAEKAAKATAPKSDGKKTTEGKEKKTETKEGAKEAKKLAPAEIPKESAWGRSDTSTLFSPKKE
ncbi:hypothetical protein HOP50_05g39220 [Chloropicon primus]|nr:hypothetical protein HOP50_05g39220 [Chloropicon primus]